MAGSKDILDDLNENFGEEAGDAYVRLQKATASYISMFSHFIAAEEGAEEFDELHRQLIRTRETLLAHPERAIEMVESLLAIVVHVGAGGTVEEWFSQVGIEMTVTKVEL